tara:strand:- start:2093 stop:2665 length:573 start_codon:yes stop_codon:yes gene_type:complete
MLEELQVPYQVELLEYGTSMKSKSYLAVNPMGKVPAISHRGKIVTECAAICAYLADAFPEQALAPDLKDRAQYYRWMFFAAGPLESAVTNEALRFQVPSRLERMAGYGNFEHTVETLAHAVSRSNYVAGDRFSAADVYVGSHVGWGLEFGTLPKRTEFVLYFNRLKDRPAYKRANDLDDELTKQLGSGNV